MEERIQRIIDSEGLTPARFAEILGVQRSAISHILTGRNKPSFELINKLLTSFPAISADWLITGKGEMRKIVVQRSLFDDLEQMGNVKSEVKKDDQPTSIPDKNEKFTNVNIGYQPINNDKQTDVTTQAEVVHLPKAISRVMVLYDDGTFDTYTPSVNI